MSGATLLAIAVALSLDAFAVSASTGCAVRGLRPGHYLRMAGAFGLFQFCMPLIGWYCGSAVRGYIEAWDHWVAFALLAWVGGAMLRPALGELLFAGRMRKAPSCPVPDGPAAKDPTGGANLLILAVATSIDALAVGLSLSMIGVDIWLAALLIGIVCAAISAFGLFLGARLARSTSLGSRAELVGGIALIAIGVNILHAHGVF